MTSYENPHHYIGGFGVAPRRQRRCGVCHQTGHDRRNCPVLNFRREAQEEIANWIAAVETPPPYEEVAPPVYKPTETYRQEQQQLFDEMWDASETQKDEDAIDMVEIDFLTPPLNSCGLETADNDIVLSFVVEPTHGWIFYNDAHLVDGIIGQVKSTDVDWDEENAFDDDDVEWWVDFMWQ